jgi:hypothetical protein
MKRRGLHRRGRTFALLTLTLAFATPAFAQADACAGLADPIPAYVERFAQDTFAVLQASMAPNAVRPTVPVTGWPYAQGASWHFQYPPAWQLRDVGATYAWVSDARDASHMLFVQVDQVTGNPTPEQLFYGVLGDTIGPRTACREVRVLATDTARLFTAVGGYDDSGVTYAWVFRWIDARFGKMTGSLQLTVHARGVYTAYGWGFTTAPEAELEATARDAFGPMTFSFYAAPPGGTDRDTDFDGVPDEQDAFPEDPTRH